MNLKYETEQLVGKWLYLTFLGIVNVDFVVPSLKVAIEVDGPSHFISTPDGSMTLSMTTKAKHRLLKNCGLYDHVFQVTGNLATTDINNFDDIME